MQVRFEVGAVNRFYLSPNIYDNEIDFFIYNMVIILYGYDLFQPYYNKASLRDHLGTLLQYVPYERMLRLAVWL